MAPGRADRAAWGSAHLTGMGLVQHTTFLPQEEPLHHPEPLTALSGWAQRLAPRGTPFCQAHELSKGGCPDLDLGCDRRRWRASFGSGRSRTLCKLMLQETLERLTVAGPSDNTRHLNNHKTARRSWGLHSDGSATSDTKLLSPRVLQGDVPSCSHFQLCTTDPREVLPGV